MLPDGEANACSDEEKLKIIRHKIWSERGLSSGSLFRHWSNGYDPHYSFRGDFDGNMLLLNG